MLGAVAVLEGHTQVCHKVTFSHCQAYTGESSQPKSMEECKQSVSAWCPHRDLSITLWVKSGWERKRERQKERKFCEAERGRHLGFSQLLHGAFFLR